MRKPIIAANWKMNNLSEEVVKFFNEFGDCAIGLKDREVVIAPAFPYLKMAVDLAKGKNILIAAQDVYPEDEGAFTGMVGAKMLNDIGVKAVIIGHSERRHIFKESLELIRKKVNFVQTNGWKLIFCIGETLPERESGKLYDIIKEQIYTAFDGNLWCETEMSVIAYEPVWAIGTGVVATPEQATEMHAFIRKIMKERYHREDTVILYGGSVKPDNVKGLMSSPDIDGALVGGASLKADSFKKLVLY
ncbi:MAG TPA: triose-phosphate isomerase [bacterium]|nr:triose-phosphate isomerase [bacterium]HPS30901.1 triose-phosphate isomerase [bacterium]